MVIDRHDNVVRTPASLPSKPSHSVAPNLFSQELSVCKPALNRNGVLAQDHTSIHRRTDPHSECDEQSVRQYVAHCKGCHDSHDVKNGGNDGQGNKHDPEPI